MGENSVLAELDKCEELKRSQWGRSMMGKEGTGKKAEMRSIKTSNATVRNVKPSGFYTRRWYQLFYDHHVVHNDTSKE